MKLILLNASKNLLYYFVCIIAFGLFLAANRIKPQYTPYQMLIWEIKANEGYRSWWYEDGFVRGKQSHSIGFGWSDQGNRRRDRIKQYTRDGKVTFDEALKITMMEIDKYGKLHNDPWKNLALQLHSYNCGLTKSGSKIAGCCGYSKGCGARKKWIRTAHNRRRKFEVALWRHDINTVEMMTRQNQDKLKIILPILKSRGEI